MKWGKFNVNAIERYRNALEQYKEKNFDEALKILDEVKTTAPYWKKPLLLEAYILRDSNRTADLFLFVQKILPRFDSTLPEEKSFVADLLNILGVVCQKLSLIEPAVELLCLSGEMTKPNSAACIEISNAILTANSSEKFSAADFKKLYDRYQKYLADITPYPRKFYNHKKIRVGYLSNDFYWHPVIKWAWALIYKLDKNFFETYCYSARKKYDIVTEYVSKTVENWRDISKLNEAKAAELIRNDEIDILFDLSGHTAGNRLRVAAYRPASVQISGIGYMNSTGLDCFDYFLSDIYCAENSEKYFTEKLIRLPHSHICFEQPGNFEVGCVPCIKKNFVTFGSFNQYGKITDSILLAWKKILDAVPNSRLILKNRVLNKDNGKTFVRNRLKSFGIDVERIDLRGLTGDYLREYDDVDIALDTYPYTGGVTTCEALYMGVPVVSLYGDRHGTRFGYSILKNIGLDELAVNSYDDYIRIAVALAGDKDLLKILRKNLRGMMKKSPLMNSEIYIRDVERAFIKIYQNIAGNTRCSPAFKAGATLKELL